MSPRPGAQAPGLLLAWVLLNHNPLLVVDLSQIRLHLLVTWRIARRMKQPRLHSIMSQKKKTRHGYGCANISLSCCFRPHWPWLSSMQFRIATTLQWQGLPSAPDPPASTSSVCPYSQISQFLKLRNSPNILCSNYYNFSSLSGARETES